MAAALRSCSFLFSEVKKYQLEQKFSSSKSTIARIGHHFPFIVTPKVLTFHTCTANNNYLIRLWSIKCKYVVHTHVVYTRVNQ